jgi:uncharacterized protein (DUF1501 family)
MEHRPAVVTGLDVALMPRKTMMDRRSLVKLACSGAAGLLLPSLGTRTVAYAVPAMADTRFLLVFLRGGYDAANVVIPAGSAFYYESRPTLAIAKPDPANPQAAVALGTAGDAALWALHPALRESIYPLWQRGQVAFVPFAGTNDLSRSHFETQDSVEAGASGDRQRSYGSGFMNRLARRMGGAAAPVAFTDGLPMVMTGDLVVPNVSLKGTARTPFDARQTALFASLYEGTRFEPLIAEGFDLRKTVADEAAAMASGTASAEMQAANRNAISARGFEVEARRMAGLMRDRFNLGFIDVGGWDTHVNQGAAQGQLANLLTNLGQGLAGFAEQMGPRWTNTVVVVISEFGRTFRENGTRGTDHGHGTAYWVLGGSVHGGRIAGDQVAVEPRSLNQNRDWPVLTEYRALLGGLFRRVYGLDIAALDEIFPGAQPADLDLV